MEELTGRKIVTYQSQVMFDPDVVVEMLVFGSEGAACSGAASLLHLPVKRVVGRRRPWRGRVFGIGPAASSFPSGHTASDLGFLFGASQEIPSLVVSLTLATLGSHWSPLRSRKHYPSDVVAGGAIALAVSVAASKLRPPARTADNP